MTRKTQEFPKYKRLHLALVDADSSTHAAVQKALQAMAVGWTLHSHENIERLEVPPPDVVLLSINGISGLSRFQSVKALLPTVPSIILADKPKWGDVLMYLTLGASGYWIKTSGFELLLPIATSALQGGLALCQEAQKNLANSLHQVGSQPSNALLTSREKEVMTLIIKDFTDKEIAETLRLSCGTVNAHLSNIFKKLDAHTRREARQKYLCARSDRPYLSI